ncbi:MAG: hypothetical protein AB7S26_42510 [Sandaracinaceae bacterium]
MRTKSSPNAKASEVVAKPAVDLHDVSWISPSVIEVRFRGHVTGESTRLLTEHARQLLLRGTPRAFIINCEEAKNYEPDVRGPGVRLLELLRESGATIGYAVSRSPAIRMIGTAVAFVAGTRVTFVETPREALAAIKRQLDGEPR